MSHGIYQSSIQLQTSTDIPPSTMIQLTQRQQCSLVERLLGTSLTGQTLADEYKIPLEQVKAIANTNGIGRCDGCDWWFEKAELNEDDHCNTCVEDNA